MQLVNPLGLKIHVKIDDFCFSSYIEKKKFPFTVLRFIWSHETLMKSIFFPNLK